MGKNAFLGISSLESVAVIASMRQDGNLRLDDGKELSMLARDRRNAFLRQIGIANTAVVSAQLMHGNRVAHVTKKDGGKIVRGVDGLMTSDPDLFLTITAADCLPIMFFANDPGVVAIAHTGWRGLQQGILATIVNAFKKKYGVAPRNLVAEVGPGICVDHYRFPEVAAHFFDAKQSWKQYDDGTHLNLQALARQQLLTLGMQKERIAISADCTYEMPELYFSYRRDKPSAVAANLYGIALRSAKYI